jgi:hypothetical protein
MVQTVMRYYQIACVVAQRKAFRITANTIHRNAESLAFGNGSVHALQRNVGCYDVFSE